MAWFNEFPAEFAPPEQLLNLCDVGVLVDDSWGNDVCPSFLGIVGGSFVRVWADHPEEDEREIFSGFRFNVVACDADGCHDELSQEILSTNDVRDIVSLFVNGAVWYV